MKNKNVLNILDYCNLFISCLRFSNHLRLVFIKFGLVLVILLKLGNEHECHNFRTCDEIFFDNIIYETDEEHHGAVVEQHSRFLIGFDDQEKIMFLRNC